MIALGIRTMVAAIRVLQVGPTSAVAKLADRPRRSPASSPRAWRPGCSCSPSCARRGRHAERLGVAAGTAVGLPAALVSYLSSQTAATTPLSPLTWVIWRYDWPLPAGKHTFAARCIDGEGAPQITAQPPAHPSGAGGLHSRSQMP
ncbi:MAG: hypothetical protein AB1505_16090 [Candidatus Latescibacterota bacterium]